MFGAWTIPPVSWWGHEEDNTGATIRYIEALFKILGNYYAVKTIWLPEFEPSLQ